MKHDDDTALECATPAARSKPRREGPKLTDEHREYIVRRLAAYVRPSQVRREMRERFGVALTRPAIDHYDPTLSPGCGKQWADLFYTVRRGQIRGAPDLATRSGRVERLVLRTVEILASQILNGVQAEAQSFETDAGEITDEDRLRALIAFIEKLKITNPPGVAEIRRALSDDLA
jgi:hypothetical protein